MDYLQKLIERYPSLESVKSEVYAAYQTIIDSFKNGGKLLIAGNGGSASDSEHIVGELMKGFVKKREAPDTFISNARKINPEISDYLGSHLQVGLPAIALSSHTSLNTAIINDTDGNAAFAQQVYGYGNPGDVFLGISCSGNSKNIVYAAVTAKAKNLKTIALTGSNGGDLKKYSNVLINVPESETYKIQELHLPVYHTLCLMIEEYFFP